MRGVCGSLSACLLDSDKNKVIPALRLWPVCLLGSLGILAGCAFDPVQGEYSKAQVSQTVETVAPEQGLLVFRTRGFKLWEEQNAEFLINGESVAQFKAGGASYLPLEPGEHTIVVREPGHFLTCELTFEYTPGQGQFVEIYERFDPGALMISFIFADLQSRLLYDPHPGSSCVGVYGLSMGHLPADVEIARSLDKEYSFQVVKR